MLEHLQTQVEILQVRKEVKLRLAQLVLVRQSRWVTAPPQGSHPQKTRDPQEQEEPGQDPPALEDQLKQRIQEFWSKKTGKLRPHPT